MIRMDDRIERQVDGRTAVALGRIGNLDDRSEEAP